MNIEVKGDMDFYLNISKALTYLNHALTYSDKSEVSIHIETRTFIYHDRLSVYVYFDENGQFKEGSIYFLNDITFASSDQEEFQQELVKYIVAINKIHLVLCDFKEMQ